MHIDYSKLLWPESFKLKALARLHGQAKSKPDLWHLYNKFFTLLDIDLQPPVPFAHSVNDIGQEPPVYPVQEDLPLSVVVITRNDLHVERMQERTQAFIDGIVHLAESSQTNVELIIVEWNPPGDRAPFKDQFSFPKKTAHTSIRIVTVPSELHQTYRWAKQLPLYQMIGKNAGIRRARGQFVLVTNIDILLSRSLFHYITSPQVTAGNIYRSNRWDVDIDILDIEGPAKKLEAAPGKCFRINYREGGIPFEDKDMFRRDPEDFDPSQFGYPSLHTEGCGDFQMLHQKDWYKVRGYAETDSFCYHMDSLFAFTCHYAGLKEVALEDDYPHYHIDHTVGKVVNSDVYTIAENETVRHISCESITAMSSQMHHEGDYFLFNRANWGLSDHDLPVTSVTLADWDKGTPTEPALTSLNKTPTYAPLENLPFLNNQDNEQARNWLKDCTIVLGEYLQKHAANRPVYIWGAGDRGLYCKTTLSQFTDITVSAFLQSTEPCPQNDLTDIPTLQADTLDWEAPNKPFIIIASMHAEVIRQELETRGQVEGEDYLIWS